MATLGYASEVIIQDNKDGIGDDAVSSVIAGAVIYMPFAELVDIAKEKERLAKEEKTFKWRDQNVAKECLEMKDS